MIWRTRVIKLCTRALVTALRSQPATSSAASSSGCDDIKDLSINIFKAPRSHLRYMRYAIWGQGWRSGNASSGGCDDIKDLCFRSILQHFQPTQILSELYEIHIKDLFGLPVNFKFLPFPSSCQIKDLGTPLQADSQQWKEVHFVIAHLQDYPRLAPLLLISSGN